MLLLFLKLGPSPHLLWIHLKRKSELWENFLIKRGKFLISKFPFPCNQIPYKGCHRNNMTANTHMREFFVEVLPGLIRTHVFNLLPLFWLAVLLISNSDGIKFMEGGIKKVMGLWGEACLLGLIYNILCWLQNIFIRVTC